MKFVSPEVALYLCKSTICPCMECCYHVWAGAPSCYLELLDKLQKQICTTVGPSLAISFEPLADHWNVASLSLFYSIGRCSSELAQQTPMNFRFFLKKFPVCFNVFVLLFLVTSCVVVDVQSCMD